MYQTSSAEVDQKFGSKICYSVKATDLHDELLSKAFALAHLASPSLPALFDRGMSGSFLVQKLNQEC